MSLTFIYKKPNSRQPEKDKNTLKILFPLLGAHPYQILYTPRKGKKTTRYTHKHTHTHTNDCRPLSLYLRRHKNNKIKPASQLVVIK